MLVYLPKVVCTHFFCALIEVFEADKKSEKLFRNEEALSEVLQSMRLNRVRLTSIKLGCVNLKKKIGAFRLG